LGGRNILFNFLRLKSKFIILLRIKNLFNLFYIFKCNWDNKKLTLKNSNKSWDDKKQRSMLTCTHKAYIKISITNEYSLKNINFNLCDHVISLFKSLFHSLFMFNHYTWLSHISHTTEKTEKIHSKTHICLTKVFNIHLLFYAHEKYMPTHHINNGVQLNLWEREHWG